MTKLITKEQLDKLDYELNELITNTVMRQSYYKLLDSYKYYKDRVSELELQIEDLLDRDFNL